MIDAGNSRLDGEPDAMTNDQELSKLVLRAMSEPSCWKEVCRALGDIFQARNVVLTIYKKPDTPIFTAVDKNSEELVDAYWQNQRAGDIWLERAQSLPAGTVTRGSDIVPEEEMHHAPFFQNYLFPLKISHLLTGILINNDEYRAFVGLMRPPEEDDFDASDITDLQSLLPFLQMGVVSYLEIRQQKMLTGYVADGWLSVNNVGLLIVEPDYRLIYQNAYAAQFIAEEPSMTVNGGHLTFLGDDPPYQKLQKNIWRASQGDQSVAQEILFQSLFQNDKLYQFLFFNIAQFADYVDYSLEREKSCMVLIQALDQATSYLDEERLSDHWLLTKAEIRVVRGVCDGLTINEISQANEVSVHTIRAQIKSVYEKMGVNSQAELLRFVAEDSLVAVPNFPIFLSGKRGITYEVI